MLSKIGKEKRFGFANRVWFIDICWITCSSLSLTDISTIYQGIT